MLEVRFLHPSRPAVVKVFADPSAFRREAGALRHWAAVDRDGVTAVAVLDVDATSSMVVLERVDGPSVRSEWTPDGLDDIRDLARVLRVLWAVPAPAAGHDAGFPSLESWMAGLDRPAPVLDRTLPGFRARARDLGRELRADGGRSVLLHGDLHHENVLRRRDGRLCVVDPEGVLGARGFDLAAVLRNPPGWVRAVAAPSRAMAARVDLLSAELGVDRTYVRAWGWVGNVLSAVWDEEDGHDNTGTLELLGLLA